ncbi:hypothetical protein C8F04DRAFT_1275521 [Mycena alexandri]|uniref:Uncharacterized protein n=1 Tax=Mycena alexandri TaxID=1745969 RepID=A0AAD6WP66_9AGAR|nr:hypothetical protein C8F04DRAFT_1275521 [Mycena alexandri]
MTKAVGLSTKLVGGRCSSSTRFSARDATAKNRVSVNDADLLGRQEGPTFLCRSFPIPASHLLSAPVELSTISFCPNAYSVPASALAEVRARRWISNLRLRPLALTPALLTAAQPTPGSNLAREAAPAAGSNAMAPLAEGATPAPPPPFPHAPSAGNFRGIPLALSIPVPTLELVTAFCTASTATASWTTLTLSATLLRGWG